MVFKLKHDIMKKENKKIDELIKEALSKEEATFYDELEEKNLLGKLGEVHKSKLGWIAITMNIMNVIFLVGFVYCVIQFFNTQVTNEIIMWGAGGGLCFVFMSMIKFYIWMQIDKNDILKQLKRLEFQVSVLTNNRSVQ